MSDLLADLFLLLALAGPCLTAWQIRNQASDRRAVLHGSVIALLTPLLAAGAAYASILLIPDPADPVAGSPLTSDQAAPMALLHLILMECINVTVLGIACAIRLTGSGNRVSGGKL